MFPRYMPRQKNRHFIATYSVSKESVCNAGDPAAIPGLGRESLPTPVFLPGESHGQKRLVCYSPWGPKESDTTERVTCPNCSSAFLLIP